MIVLMGVAFDHHDHQTLCHLTSYCEDFLEVWGSFKIRVDCCGCPEQQSAMGRGNWRQNKYFFIIRAINICLLSVLNKF